MALTAHPPTQDLINLVGTLGGTWHGRTAMCLCPAHADKNPSLALRQGDRGILVKSAMERGPKVRRGGRARLRQGAQRRFAGPSTALRVFDEGAHAPVAWSAAAPGCGDSFAGEGAKTRETLFPPSRRCNRERMRQRLV